MLSTEFITAISEITDVPSDDSRHPFATIAKFVFVDDKPNQNGQAVPYEEFENIKRTAIGMPVKMYLTMNTSYSSESEDDEDIGDHSGSIPIGVIRNMTEDQLEDGTHRLIAEAYLWNEEFPQEVAFIKKRFSEGKPLGTSFELGYKKGIKEKGIEFLQEVATLATTFVKRPAYGRRTQLLALASRQDINEDDLYDEIIALAAQWTAAYVNNLPDSSFAYIESGGKKDSEGKTTPRSLRHLPYKDADGKVDLPHLRNALARLDQTDIPDAAKAEARRKLEAAAKKAGVGTSSTETDDKGGQKMEEELKNAKAAVDAAVEEKNKALAEVEALTKTVDEKSAEVEKLSEDNKSLAEENAKLKFDALVATRTQRMAEAGFALEANAEKAEKRKNYWASLSDEQFEIYLSDLAAIKGTKKKDEMDVARASATVEMPRLSSVVEGTEYASLKSTMRALARPHSSE